MKININVDKKLNIEVGDLIVVRDVTDEGWQREMLVASDGVYDESVRCINLENSCPKCRVF